MYGRSSFGCSIKRMVQRRVNPRLSSIRKEFDNQERHTKSRLNGKAVDMGIPVVLLEVGDFPHMLLARSC